jgi:predicted nucleic acid-binding protein
MIVDASTLICAFFPDESQAQAQKLVREHIAGRLRLKAPTLLPYELGNAIWQAERRGRVNRSQADEILDAFAGLDIEIISQARSLQDCIDSGLLKVARQFNCSVYDAAYLTLAEACNEPLITADEKLYLSVHKNIEWILLIRDYPLDLQA